MFTYVHVELSDYRLLVLLVQQYRNIHILHSMIMLLAVGSASVILSSSILYPYVQSPDYIHIVYVYMYS